MKRLFYLSASILMLALAFHFGYTTARAQAPGNPVVASPSTWAVVTANGDVYQSRNGSAGPWDLTSNVFGSGPTPAQQQSWGQLKARYAPKSAPASQRPTDR
jgi:hypothetical protein